MPGLRLYDFHPLEARNASGSAISTVSEPEKRFVFRFLLLLSLDGRLFCPGSTFSFGQHELPPQ